MFLGIDTSCYTTSIAAFDQDGRLLADRRQPLFVKSASCGLRQSEMVFQHTKNFPALLEDVPEIANNIKAICVSDKPRPLEDSYMPAFMSGLSFARVIASSTGASLFHTSHQQNHLEAGLWSAAGPVSGPFIALHASGGTTDVLLAEKTDSEICVKEIGSSSDISAGQFIDRTGVALGLDFPCGKELEKLSLQSKEAAIVPVAVKQLKASYSGPLTAVKKLIAAGCDKADVAAGVQIAIAKSFVRLLSNACLAYDVKQVLLVGGVSSNAFMREYLHKQLQPKGMKIYFPQADYCSDNAVGCAHMALEKWRKDIG